ncbi:hypothetical protein MAP00_000305 [Monascus purpureus]|nr:hypothetical protein MAP00_000305 [Monascus purpureus]
MSSTADHTRTSSASHPPWITEAQETQLLREERTLVVGQTLSLNLGSESLLVVDERAAAKSKDRGCCKLPIQKTKVTHAIALYNILDAQLSADGLTIKFAKHSSSNDISVTSIRYPIHGEEKEIVEAWTKRLLDLAYGDARKHKRLKVLINPFGGKGNAANLYKKHAAPIFAAARCHVDVQHTTHRGHATEIAEQIDINAYDAIVCCSGDGLPYEVFNGLGKRFDAQHALSKIAVAMIPCGSGNAMAWNLSGTGSVSVTALTIVKGIHTPLDLVSITQGNTRTLSFLSQAFGIVAECDLGTEKYRWMGAHRFTFGFLVRLLHKTVWPCDLAVKVEIGSKNAIKHHYAAYTIKDPTRREVPDDEEASGQQSQGLPPLKYGTVKDKLPEDWEIIPSETLGNFYAGNMAIVSKDTNFFPAAVPNDGLIDIVTVDGTIPRTTTLKMMDQISDGGFFGMPDVKVCKASAYRLTPREKEGYISVDGERIPFEPFQVEVHQGLGTVLSKSGYIYEASGPK